MDNCDLLAAQSAEAVANKSFGGRRPDASVAICRAIVAACFPEDIRVEVLEISAERTLTAVEARTVSQNARWNN